MNSTREAELKQQLRNARNIQAIAMANKNGRGVRNMTREIDRIYRELQQVRRGQ